MLQQLSEMELATIRNSMLIKSHREIADVLDLPVEEVSQAISELTKDTGLVTREMKIKKYVPVKERKVRAKKEKPAPTSRVEQKKEGIKKNLELEEARRQNNNRRNSPQFETKQIDYTQKKMIRVDRNTWAYADPGNEKAAIDHYGKHYPKRGEL